MLASFYYNQLFKVAGDHPQLRLRVLFHILHEQLSQAFMDIRLTDSFDPTNLCIQVQISSAWRRGRVYLLYRGVQSATRADDN